MEYKKHNHNYEKHNQEYEDFSLKKLLNGILVVPDDTAEWVKYGLALVVVLLSRQGIEFSEMEMLLLGGLVKGIIDAIHFSLKEYLK